jgi:histone-lysine N-methyltransferase SUV39H
LKLCIFRTSNGCGWGVKTLETIRKNSFVIEYVGEIITNEEAEKRGVQYGKLIESFHTNLKTTENISHFFLDSEGRTYLFDLDFNDIDCVYSVDAAHQGNVAHFINHSVNQVTRKTFMGLLINFSLFQCDPNLAVFAMWANCMDPNMPRLALFAQRDIHVGEELTFDYASSKTGNFFVYQININQSNSHGEYLHFRKPSGKNCCKLSCQRSHSKK